MNFPIFFVIFLISTFEVQANDLFVKSIQARIAFEDFKFNNNKTYATLNEELEAYVNFRDTLWLVKEHNKEFRSGNSTFQMSINNYADKSEDYFIEVLNDFLEDPMQQRGSDELPHFPKCELTFLNYSMEGSVNVVKNQGRCGACWAFAAAGACEGALYKKTKVLWKIAEQQLVDCTYNDYYGNYGCRGGRISVAYSYMMKHAPMNESDYKYRGKDNGTCETDPKKGIMKIKNFVKLSNITEDYLKDLLCAVGPVSVGIDASSRLYQFYSSGVYNDDACAKTINHAMVLIGFGNDPLLGDYWLFKNSYGRTWGERGYIRFARGTGNLCGMLEQVTYCVV